MIRVCVRCGTVFDHDVRQCPTDGADCVEVSSADAALPGRVLEERYQVLRLLDAGGMGAVFEARQLSTGRDVAIKVVRAENGWDSRAMRRFRTEVGLLCLLSNPHVVAVYDLGRTLDGRVFVVMERLQGRTLHAEIQAVGRLEPRRAVGIAAQVCGALVEPHGKGILHRDLKPGNVFLLEVAGAEDFAKVLDFGVARLVAQPSPLTSSGFVHGTPPYISPEQALGQPLDGRSDLYSVGVMLFEMLTGRVPFTERNPVVLMRVKSTQAAPRLREACDGLVVPGFLEDAVARLLATDARERPRDGREARDLLLRSIDGLADARPAPVAGRGLAAVRQWLGRLSDRAYSRGGSRKSVA